MEESKMANGAAAAGAAAITTGVVVGMAMAEEEKEKNLRISHEGRDQILIKIKEPEDKILDVLSNTFGNWYNDGENLYRKADGWFSWEFAIIIGVISFFVIAFIDGIFNPTLQSNYGQWWGTPTISGIPGLILSGFPLSNPWMAGFLIGIILGAIAGYFGNSDDYIDYIRVKTAGDYCTVLIKKYNSSGYRNIDEDDINIIIEHLKSEFGDGNK
jgi:hypothetical protein